MTKFTNGPLAGKVLQLRRAPMLLRATHDVSADAFDALDQLDDKPKRSEEIYVYRKVEDNGMIHINARDKHGKHCGGFYPMATYVLHDPQPAQDVCRNNQKWQEWAQEEKSRLDELTKPA